MAGLDGEIKITMEPETKAAFEAFAKSIADSAEKFSKAVDRLKAPTTTYIDKERD